MAGPMWWSKVLRACTKCGRLTEGNRCPEHKPKDHRPGARRRGYDNRWERTRHAFLRANPNCHEDGCLERATDVHHLDGLGPKGPRGHDWMNLEALCHAHHSQRTAAEQPGGFRVSG